MIGALLHTVSRCVLLPGVTGTDPGQDCGADFCHFPKAYEGRKGKQPAMGLSTDKNTNKMKVHFGNRQ